MSAKCKSFSKNMNNFKTKLLTFLAAVLAVLLGLILFGRWDIAWLIITAPVTIVSFILYTISAIFIFLLLGLVIWLLWRD